MADMGDNVGVETLRALEETTSSNAEIFRDAVNLERVASMLNYFLAHLVGPKRRELIVRDKSQYEFKPDILVQSICRIYVHLGVPSTSEIAVPSSALGAAPHSPSQSGASAEANSAGASAEQVDASCTEELSDTDRFCVAIFREERSYSKDLLRQALQVLTRVGASSQLIESYTTLADRVHFLENSVSFSVDDIPVEEIPEEFVDPIMGMEIYFAHRWKTLSFSFI